MEAFQLKEYRSLILFPLAAPLDPASSVEASPRQHPLGLPWAATAVNPYPDRSPGILWGSRTIPPRWPPQRGEQNAGRRVGGLPARVGPRAVALLCAARGWHGCAQCLQGPGEKPHRSMGLRSRMVLCSLRHVCLGNTMVGIGHSCLAIPELRVPSIYAIADIVLFSKF